MTTILAFALVITVLVFIHELGHFLAARWYGVPVEVFSIGFGPRVLSVRRSGIEYRLSAIPFGGYVKMAGTSPAGARTTDGFDSKTPWQRFVILLAGPAMNVGLAFALTVVALWCGIELPAYRSSAPVVAVVANDSAAHRADIRKGDRIVAVSGQAVSSWASVDAQVATRRNQNILLRIERDDAQLTTVIPAQLEAHDSLTLGLLPQAHPVVRGVERGGAADLAGVRPGDVIAAINDEPTTVITDVEASLSQNAASAATLAIVRDGRPQTVTIPTSRTGNAGVAAAVPTAVFRPEPLDALVLGVQAIAGSSVQILQTVAGLITGEISMQHLIGPVGLAQIAGESTQLGWRALLAAMAFISLNLGLCNLLPIPILDGGHMLMLLFEGVTRRDVPFRIRKALVGAGAIAMLALLVTTFYNDLGRLGWFPL